MSIKSAITTSAITLFWCLFFGFTIISIAGGAVYPPINSIAKPFVCPTGNFDFGQAVYRPSPGETVTTTTWYCQDASGEKKVLNVFEVTLPAGIIYGLIAFIPVEIYVVIWRSNKAERDARKQAEIDRQAQERMAEFEKRNADRQDLLNELHQTSVELQNTGARLQIQGEGMHRFAELAELKKALNAGLITQQDYDQKKADILAKF